jgi:hypothetical protein
MSLTTYMDFSAAEARRVERWTIPQLIGGRFRLHINFGGRGFWCMFD